MKTAKLIASVLSSFSLALPLVFYGQPSKAQQTAAGRDNIQLQSKLGSCLDANTGDLGREAYMRPCDNGQNINLLWDTTGVIANKTTSYFIRTNTGIRRCLDANTGKIGKVAYMRACNASNPNHLWYFQKTSFFSPYYFIKSRTTGYCLDANTGQLGKPVYMRPCDRNNPNLLWRFRTP